MSDFPPNCDECEQCESWTKRNRLKNWYEGDENEKEESIDRSSSDLELVLAAYPDDTSVVTKTDNVLVLPSPLFSFTLHLPDHRILSDTMHQKFHDKGTKAEATLIMTMPIGYPCHRPMIIDISSSSSLSSSFQLASLSPSFSGGSITMGLKVTLEAARNAANEVFTTEGRGEESGLACCEAALGEWITYWEELKQTSIRNRQSGRMQNSTQSVPSTDPFTISGRSIHDEKVKDNGGNCSDSCGSDAKWITAEDTIVDKKSIFRAHLCAVQTEEQVQRALSRLPLVHPKVNKATVCYDKSLSSFLFIFLFFFFYVFYIIVSYFAAYKRYVYRTLRSTLNQNIPNSFTRLYTRTNTHM